MNKLYIYLNDNKIQLLLSKADDVDSIRILDSSIDEPVSLTHTLEELVYENPDFIRCNASTHVLLDFQKASLLPGSLTDDDIAGLLNSAWNDNETNEEWLTTSLPTETGLISAVSAPSELVRFFERSFHPLKIEWAMNPFISRWKNTVDEGESDFTLFIQYDCNILYAGIFHGKELIFANRFTCASNEIAAFFLLSVLNNLIPENKKIKCYIYSTVKTVDDYMENILMKRGVEVKRMIIATKSSFVSYILDTQEIESAIKAAVEVC